jgi:hypothetical protein
VTRAPNSQEPPNDVSTIDDQDDTDVCYLQSQNGNIWDRFKEEEEDDPPELSRFQEYVLRGPRVMQKLGEIGLGYMLVEVGLLA